MQTLLCSLILNRPDSSFCGFLGQGGQSAHPIKCDWRSLPELFALQGLSSLGRGLLPGPKLQSLE
jgi:hypothetical protein